METLESVAFSIKVNPLGKTLYYKGRNTQSHTNAIRHNLWALRQLQEKVTSKLLLEDSAGLSQEEGRTDQMLGVEREHGCGWTRYQGKERRN